MSLRFLTDGTVVVDTVTEALDFERGRTAKPKYNAKPKPASRPALDAELAGTWEGFCQLLEARGATRMRKLLALVKGRHPGATDLHELQKLMTDPTLMTTSGTLSGITKNAVKAGIQPTEVLVRGPGTEIRAGVLLQARDPPEP